MIEIGIIFLVMGGWGVAVLVYALITEAGVIGAPIAISALLLLGASVVANGVVWRWKASPTWDEGATPFIVLPFTLFAAPLLLTLPAGRAMGAGLRAAGFERCEGEVRERCRREAGLFSRRTSFLPDVYALVRRCGCAGP